MSERIVSGARMARLTAEQVHAMVRAGILEDGAPIELMDGLLVYKDRSALGEDPMTIGEKHNLCVQLLGLLAGKLGAHGCYVQTQGPVRLSAHDELEPDGAVLRGQPRDYADRLPTAADAMSIIEVADSSLEMDRTSKLARYPKSGIAQYVIVNLQDLVVEIHEQPTPEATYQIKTLARSGDAMRLRTGTDRYLELDAARLLP